MEFKDFTGKIHKVNPNFKDYRTKDEETCRSIKQYELGKILVEIYGVQSIVEDHPLPGCANLSFDFWMPHKKVAFEYDGVQHQKFNKFFHKNKAGFMKQLRADARKEQIAEINGITLYTVTGDFTKEDILALIIGEPNES